MGSTRIAILCFGVLGLLNDVNDAFAQLSLIEYLGLDSYLSEECKASCNPVYGKAFLEGPLDEEFGFIPKDLNKIQDPSAALLRHLFVQTGSHVKISNSSQNLIRSISKEELIRLISVLADPGVTEVLEKNPVVSKWAYIYGQSPVSKKQCKEVGGPARPERPERLERTEGEDLGCNGPAPDFSRDLCAWFHSDCVAPKMGPVNVPRGSPGSEEQVIYERVLGRATETFAKKTEAFRVADQKYKEAKVLLNFNFLGTPSALNAKKLGIFFESIHSSSKELAQACRAIRDLKNQLGSFNAIQTGPMLASHSPEEKTSCLPIPDAGPALDMEASGADAVRNVANYSNSSGNKKLKEFNELVLKAFIDNPTQTLKALQAVLYSRMERPSDLKLLLTSLPHRCLSAPPPVEDFPSSRIKKLRLKQIAAVHTRKDLQDLFKEVLNPSSLDPAMLLLMKARLSEAPAAVSQHNNQDAQDSSESFSDCVETSLLNVLQCSVAKKKLVGGPDNESLSTFVVNREDLEALNVTPDVVGIFRSAFNKPNTRVFDVMTTDIFDTSPISGGGKSIRKGQWWKILSRAEAKTGIEYDIQNEFNLKSNTENALRALKILIPTLPNLEYDLLKNFSQRMDSIEKKSVSREQASDEFRTHRQASIQKYLDQVSSHFTRSLKKKVEFRLEMTDVHWPTADAQNSLDEAAFGLNDGIALYVDGKKILDWHLSDTRYLKRVQRSKWGFHTESVEGRRELRGVGHSSVRVNEFPEGNLISVEDLKAGPSASPQSDTKGLLRDLFFVKSEE